MVKFRFETPSVENRRVQSDGFDLDLYFISLRGRQNFLLPAQFTDRTCLWHAVYLTKDFAHGQAGSGVKPNSSLFAAKTSMMN